MSGTLQTNLYAIYDTHTSQFLKFGSKIAWTGAGPAKNAYNLHEGKSWSKLGHKFDEQSRYIVVTLDAEYFKDMLEDK